VLRKKKEKLDPTGISLGRMEKRGEAPVRRPSSEIVQKSARPERKRKGSLPPHKAGKERDMVRKRKNNCKPIPLPSKGVGEGERSISWWRGRRNPRPGEAMPPFLPKEEFHP